MKKIIFRTMAIVLVLGVAACSRTDETADTPSDQKITELGVIAQSTRSTLGDDNWVEWDANDSFSVFSSMSFSSEFTIKELLDEGHGAKLEGMTIPADTYYILYPYIMDAMIAEGKIHARNIVPATQPLVENTFDHKQNPAVGHTEGAETVAPMKNIAGLVKVRVTGKIDLRRITLMSNSDNELIAGTGTIDAKTSELTIDESEGSASVTLTASKSIPLTDTPKTFYFVVAPRTFASGFTLTFIGSKEGKNYRFTHTTHNEATITASKILNITKVFDIDITEETVEMEPGITYTADKEIFISDNTFVPAALDSDYDETTKTGRIYFEKGVEPYDCRNLKFFCEKTYEFHHDHRSDRNTDIVFLALIVYKILDDLGNHSLVSVRAVICCHIEISGNSLHLLLKDQQILCLGSHDDINIDPMFL